MYRYEFYTKNIDKILEDWYYDNTNSMIIYSLKMNHMTGGSGINHMECDSKICRPPGR
jgi:hypothetical protein